jgi:ParB family chromosome partitioning protein
VAETRARGLGLGLSALLGDAAAPAGDERLIEIPLDQLRPNARQPRAHFDESELAELVASIAQDGVLQPVLVRPARDGRGFELIAGERRWRAARAAGLAAVPAIVREADREALALAVVENVVRTDLDPIEEARAYARLCDEMGLTQAEVAQAVGRSRVAITNGLRLLDLPDDVIALLERRELSEGHGRALLLAPDHEDRRRLAAEAIRKSWSVRALETAARAAAGREQAAPTRRRTGTPSWLEPAAADDLVDAAYAAFGVPARLAVEGEGIRLELRIRDADELAGLRNALEAAGMLRVRPGD